SLLEGLVYGARAAQNMREHLRAARKNPAGSAKGVSSNSNGQPAETEKFIRKVQSLMWQYVGVVREGKNLRQVVAELSALPPPTGDDRRAWEATNMLQAGLLIASSALA